MTSSEHWVHCGVNRTNPWQYRLTKEQFIWPLFLRARFTVGCNSVSCMLCDIYWSKGVIDNFEVWSQLLRAVKRSFRPAEGVGNHDQGRLGTALRTASLRPGTMENGLGESLKELAQDRRAWSASIREVVRQPFLLRRDPGLPWALQPMPQIPSFTYLVTHT